MADFSALIQRIKDAVYENGVQAITGQILQDCLKDVVNTVNVAKQDGIYRITVSVDNNTGVPSGTARMDDDTYTLELSFHNLKGEKGDKGDKGDTPVLTADSDGVIYSDGVLLTRVIKDTTDALTTRADSDHARAESDHARAETDHTDITRASLDAETATSEANYASLRANTAADNADAARAAIQSDLAAKQDVIPDLQQIRAGATDTVKYSTQSLTDAQKEQARTNIGAADADEVSQLRSEMDEKLDAYEIVSELPINATADGWYLKGDGYSTSNTSYRIRKYQVTSGMSLYLRLSKDSPGVYQFQDQASVPSSGTLHVIGEPVTTATDGVVTVPQGATYLIVSLLKTNTSNEVNIVNTYDEKVISEIAISSNSSRLFNNRYIDNNAAIIEDKDWVISPKIKCSQGALIKWKSGYANTSIYISIVAFNSAGEKLGYYSVGTTQQEYRSFTADWSGIAYVIASFYKGNTGGYLEIDGVRLIEITAQTLLSLDDQPITVLDNDVIANNISKEPSVVSCASLLGTDSFKVAGKLTLLWLSDIHGNATNLSRIVRYGKYHSQLFSDIIHTGDSVLSTISNADPFQSVNGAEKILNVIGNHEAWLSSSDTDYNATEKQTYDKIFAPNIANWDVVQPANAADNGYCYYYKDYTTEKFRLIVLDSVHWHYRNGVAQQNAAQKSWFESVLADAKTQGLTVICATHYTPQNGINPVPNTGFNLLGATAGGNIADGWYASDEMFGCVDDFVINGGKFAGWIVGHTHTDYIGTVFNHNSQPIVIMGTSGTTSRNNKFLSGTSSQDNFDVITFEVLSNKSIVKVVKLGQDTDIYLRSKKTICYDFTDSNLISTT